MANTMANTAVEIVIQNYLDDAEGHLESDGFMPGIDITHQQAKEVLHDFLLYYTIIGLPLDAVKMYRDACDAKDKLIAKLEEMLAIAYLT